MNFNNKIKELQDQAKMLEQQAYLMLVMQGASGNGVQCTPPQQFSNQNMPSEAYKPPQKNIMPPAFNNINFSMMAVLQQMPVQQQMPIQQQMPFQQQVYAPQNNPVMPVCPPHTEAFNNQLEIITTQQIITRVHPKLTDLGMDVIMEKILQEQPPSLPLRDKVIQYIDRNMDSFLRENLRYKQEFFCVCDPDGKKPLKDYKSNHVGGKNHQDMIDDIVKYIKQEMKKYGVSLC